MAAADAGEAPRRAARIAAIPRATYRVQLTSAFTLKDASALVPYLAELGVSHVYCSPYFKARPGSSHGYDVVDHNSINPEIGTRADLDHFVATLRAHSMGHILDLVPNHVGIMGAENARWMDVLENGQASVHARFFDIDWQSEDPALTGKVLVPVLGDHYGEVLERGDLQLRFEPDSGSFAVFYHAHRFPLDPRNHARILERALAGGGRDRLAETDRAEIEHVRAAFDHLPDRSVLDGVAIEERNRDKEILRQRLATLGARSPELVEAIAATVQAMNGTPGNPASFDALHQLLESQAYRLAYWRVAADEINYRRFFDVNDLAALRMENEAVFAATRQ
jgi:(1->4)-alpha-D-glucan 1-alpha-D-glucosylmutase